MCIKNFVMPENNCLQTIVVFTLIFVSSSCTSSNSVPNQVVAKPQIQANISKNPRQKSSDDPLDSLAKLPLPDTPTLFGIQNFVTNYKPAMAGHGSLTKELQAYFRTLNSHPDQDEEEKTISLRLRVEENLPKAHWVFVEAVRELFQYMNSESSQVFNSEKEANFVARMKVVSFLAAELSEAFRNERYLDFARKVYIQISERHFGRAMDSDSDLPE